jgi:DNA polymerase III alpha subunit
MFDVLQTIRTLSLADEHNPVKRTGRFHFPSGNDLAGFHAEAARDSLEISEQCDFEFELGGLRFPRYQPKDGSTARNFLRRLTIEGVHRRYGRSGPYLAKMRSTTSSFQSTAKSMSMSGSLFSTIRSRLRNPLK